MNSNDSLANLLQRATGQGIISAEQAAALRALSDASVDEPSGRVEAHGGFNSVTVAYSIGALFVIFALGWFLFDRWNALGPGGVLMLSSVYALLLGGVGVWLQRREFTLAAGIAFMLTVFLVPLVVWSLLVVIGVWPGSAMNIFNAREQRANAWWSVVDVVTVAIGALLYRRFRHSAVMVPLGLSLWLLGVHLAHALAGPLLTGRLERWALLTTGLGIFATAGLVERAQARDTRVARSDAAMFLWVVAIVASAVGLATVMSSADEWTHLLLPISLALVAMSLYLRRRTHLVGGVLGVFVYLWWVADEYFRTYLSLPAILATLGILLILVTVWLQRRFPALVERVSAGRGGQSLPPMVTTGPFILALGVTLLSIPDAREARVQNDFRMRLYEAQRKSGSDTVRMRGMRREPPPPKPDSAGVVR